MIVNKKYQIISDGACDLTEEEIKQYDLEVLPFYVSFDGINYRKIKTETEIREFYQLMIDNPSTFPKTSMPSVQDYINAFESYASINMPIICICMTSKMSGSFNSASVARQQVLEKYSNAKIEVINSTLITGLQGLLVTEVCRMQKDQVGYDDAIANIKRIIPTGRIIFTVENLDYIKQGGRIGKVAYWIGTALKIKPIIIFSEGEITSQEKAIGQKRSMRRIAELTKNYFQTFNEKISDYLIALGFGYSKEDSVHLKKHLFELISSIETSVFQIGATIAAHTGPYPVGLGFIKKYDA